MAVTKSPLVCTVKVACDGNNLVNGRTVMCSKCEERTKKIAREKEKAAKQGPWLKGEKLYPSK